MNTTKTKKYRFAHSIVSLSITLSLIVGTAGLGRAHADDEVRARLIAEGELAPLKLDKARFRVAVEPIEDDRAGPSGEAGPGKGGGRPGLGWMGEHGAPVVRGGLGLPGRPGRGGGGCCSRAGFFTALELCEFYYSTCQGRVRALCEKFIEARTP